MPSLAMMIALLPAIAVAAAAEPLRLFGQSLAGLWISLGLVQVLTVLGYCCSSLAKWAKWPDGSLEERLTIVQGVATSLLAGNASYFGGVYYLPSLGMAPSEIACFIASAFAGYGGEKFVSPLLSSLTDYLSRILPGQKRGSSQ